MTDQPTNPRASWDPRGWSAGKIMVFVLALAAFVVMLTWDRGHFTSEQAVPTKQAK
ncbi:MAG: hypothetical protein ACKVP3_14320 [Hyphomicrobiaceae bacterium]